jgi:type VI secretion system protein ImpH
MASPAGPPPGAVDYLAALEAEAPRLDFFAVVRRIEALHPDKPGFGRSLRPADDPIRLGQEPSLDFAPGMLAGFRPDAGGRYWLRGHFFGLFGPNGPLPRHLTEHAIERKFERDPAFAHFADIFHHRMLSLLYRAWAASRPTVSFDRPHADRFASRLAATIGLGQASLRGRDSLPDHAKLHYAGLLGLQTRSAEGLRTMLAGFFQVPVRIVEFTGAWMKLPVDCRLRLGVSPDTGALGQSAVVGAGVWGCQQRFRIELGPLSLPDFLRFLPGGLSLRRLRDLVRNYLGDEKDWDARLTLRRGEVPRTQLGRAGQLGWTTWLQATEPRHDRSDLVLAPTPQASFTGMSTNG